MREAKQLFGLQVNRLSAMVPAYKNHISLPVLPPTQKRDAVRERPNQFTGRFAVGIGQPVAKWARRV